MPLPNCPSAFDCDLKNISIEQLLKRYLIEDDGTGCLRLKTSSSGGGGGGGAVTLPSATRSYTRTLVTSTGSIATGSRHLTFETSEDFDGTIAGAIAYPSRNYTIEVNQNDDKIGSVNYTIVTGSIIINKLA